MNSSLKLLLAVPTLFLFACGGSTDPVEPRDAGTPPVDSGQPTDAGGLPADAGTEDAGTGDAGTVDAGVETPPQAPTLIGTQPDALGSEPRPLVLGTAEPGVTVDLYSSFVCSGAVLATGTVGEQGRFAIAFPVTLNAATYVSAKARRGTLSSGCSATYESYTHDDRVPRVDEVTPALNATGVSLTVAPSARFSEPMADGTVKLAVTCGGQPVTGTLVASGNRATFTPATSLPEGTSCTVTVSEGTDLAGNALAAAHSWSFTTLRVPNPNPPTLTGTTPTSPDTSTTPSVFGTATAGLRVELFTSSDCSGSAVASGTAAAGGAFSIPVTVATNATTSFRGQTVDAAGRRSTCSSTLVGYRHDGAAPTLVSVSPAANATGVARTSVVRATLSEIVTGVPSSLVLTCGGQRVTGTTTFAATTVTFSPSAMLPYDFTCTATLETSVTDVAGNPLAAAYSWSFTLELGPAPNAPTFSGVSPASPGRSTTPTLTGNATAGIAVDLFTTADCSGTAVASGTANASGVFSISATVAENSTTTFRAQARNAAGRRSACSSQNRTYVHDAVAPTITLTRPDSNAVGVETNALVTVTFSESVRNTSGVLTVECGGVARPGTVTVSGAVLTLTPSQPLPFDVSCTARVSISLTDLAGNPLAAAYSWSFTMRDSPIPGPPTLSQTTPASPGNSLTPRVSGTATAGHLIELYTGGDCSGTPVASGTVDAQGRFAIDVPVGANATTFITATARVSLARPASSCTSQVLVYRHDGVAPTVTAVSPVNEATDVQPTATLFVDFSELITAQTGDVELRCSDVLLPGTVSVAERRLTFTPAVQLWIEATCTVTVGTGVRDVAGNALASGYSWSFMTRPFGWNPGPVVATSSLVASMELGLSNAGDATLVWAGDQNPYATTRHELNPQQGVSSGLRLNTATSRDPAVATSPNGHSVIAWVESTSGVPARIMATVFVPGLGWTRPEMVSTSGLGPMDPQVAIDNSGQALVVFRQHPSDSVLSYSIFARRFLPATGWQGLVEIDGVPQEFVDTREPTVTRDGRGGFLVVWSGEFNRGSGYNYYLFFNWLRAGSTPGSANWTGAMYFFNELAPSRPRAGCDAQGNCTIVYENRGSRARAVRYEPGTDWGTPFSLGPTDASTQGVGVSVNAIGQVVAAFSHYSSTLGDHEVMVRHFEPGIGWSEAVSVSPLTSSRSTGFYDVGIDAQGNAVVLFRHGPDASLYASRYRVGVGWLPAQELDSNVGWSSSSSIERARGPRVVMNASGRTLVGYWKASSVYARWLE